MRGGSRRARPDRADAPDTHPCSAASDAFARLIAPSPRAALATRPAELIGLEHEFVVRAPDRVIDFRELVRGLPLGGRPLDPGDRNAHRCAWGGVVTADGAEAEIAIPPLPRRPGFAARLERGAIHAREALRRALPAGLELVGYSTHLSLSMPKSINAAACRLFLSTFAPGLMLLADRAGSPGLLVRPRPGRMELATEYASGSQLQAVAAYAAGAAIATADALRSGARPLLPPRVRAHAVQTADRYGWGLRRDAYGDDLLRGGRATRLRRTAGGTIGAQEHLELAWAAARAAIARGARPADLDAADRMVSGRTPFALEDPAAFGDRATAITIARQSTAYGAILRTRERARFTVSAEIATWDTTVFAIAGLWRRAFASVPRASLPRFLRALDQGQLDGVITRYLDAPASGRLLGSWSEAVRPGLYDALAPGRLLLAAEAPTVSVSKSSADRFGKAGSGNPLMNVRPDHPFQWIPWFDRVWGWRLFIRVAPIAVAGLVTVLLYALAVFGPRPQPAAEVASPSIATATAAPAAAAGLRIVAFRAVLVPPATTYTVDVSNPGGGALTYEWSANNPCGSFQPSTGPTAVWSHPHDVSSRASCPAQPIHPATITVTVRDAAGNETRYTYTGGSAPAEIEVAKR